MSKDTIYRQDAIEAVDNACRDWRGTFRRCEDALKALPSADPDVITMRVDIDKEQFARAWKQALANSPLTVLSAENTGKWIPVTNGRGGHECDQCHEYAPSWQTGEEHLTNYCPKCGARMEKEE